MSPTEWAVITSHPSWEGDVSLPCKDSGRPSRIFYMMAISHSGEWAGDEHTKFVHIVVKYEECGGKVISDVVYMDAETFSMAKCAIKHLRSTVNIPGLVWVDPRATLEGMQPGKVYRGRSGESLDDLSEKIRGS